MARLCPWTVAFMACLCSAIGARAFSAYDKKLELLSTIVNKDYLWKKIFLESIVYKLDRTYYQHIIDYELLKNALYQPPTTDEVQGTSAAPAGGEGTTGKVEAFGGGEMSGAGETTGSVVTDSDRIIPYEFVRNIMLNNRYVVGSILDMGLQVLMVSFKCLLYKHMVHLIYLIRMEMKRNKNQKKAVSWAGKSKSVIESILMTMGALQFTDIHVLATLSFFDIYQTKGMAMESDVKNEYYNILETRSTEMLDFICKNCVEIPKHNEDTSMEEQVAKMIGVSTNPGLYNVGESFGDMPDYKEMIKESWLQLHFVFGDLPWINGMSTPTWNDIFKYQERFKLK